MGFIIVGLSYLQPAVAKPTFLLTPSVRGDECSREQEMKGQTKQVGRLRICDDNVFIQLPFLSPHQGQAQPLLTKALARCFCQPCCHNHQHLFSTFLCSCSTEMERNVEWLMAVSCNSSALSVSLFQLRVNYNGQENTCTWLHATTHGKFIFHSVLWKTSVLPVQLQSGEQHILWQTLSVSAKEIRLAVFIERVRFRPRRVTEWATVALWKEKSGKKMLEFAICTQSAAHVGTANRKTRIAYGDIQ